MNKAINLTEKDHEAALAHLALRQQERRVVFSSDRRFSLVAEGGHEDAPPGQNDTLERWSYFAQFASNGDGLDEMIAFVNWCGSRNMPTTRTISENSRAMHGIVGWIDDPALAVEFRNKWM